MFRFSGFGPPEDASGSQPRQEFSNNGDTVNRAYLCMCVCVSLVVAFSVCLVLDKNWLQYTTTSGTTSTGTAFTLLSLILRIWLGQIITWDQVHHGRFA